MDTETGTVTEQHEDLAPTTVQCIEVWMDGSRYAVPMEQVTEVGRLTEITRVPGMPPYVSGVSNWRGRVLAIVDLRGRLGGSTSAPSPDSARVVVLSVGGVVVGIVVDRVAGVIELDPEALEPMPATVDATAVALLAGQGADQQGPVSLLSTHAIAALREQVAPARSLVSAL